MPTQTLTDLVAAVDDGATVAFGGKTLHRAPMAFVRELVRAGPADLTLLGLANSMDVDLLCAAGQVSAVHYGYVGFEWLGLAPNFRRAAEDGGIDPIEGTCYTVATKLRAARQGVPFLPVAGLAGSDLRSIKPDLEAVADPFTGETTTAVRAVRPDIAVVHASEADPSGNARFAGADLTERLVARAAETVVVTAERIVSPGTFEERPASTAIPGFLVDGVAEVPYGAHPLSMPDRYTYDTGHLQSYLDRSPEEVDGYLRDSLGTDEEEYRAAAIEGREVDLDWDRPMPGPVIDG